MTTPFALLRQRLWPPTEPALADAGREGERVIARVRVVVALLLAVGPLLTLHRHAAETPAWLAPVLGAGFLGVGVWTQRLARRQTPPLWLSFLTIAVDVTLVSVYQITIVGTGIPSLALTSHVTFALYILVILATSLRHDGRVTVLAGVLAATEWLAVVAWANHTGPAAATSPAERLPSVDLGGQWEELVVIAGATALALVIVDRARALRVSSIRDGLTGLLSRSYFEERFALELERMARHQRPLALAVIDLDRFKAVNDTWGHPAGDTALREAANRLRRVVRRTDLVARTGGDEFAIVMTETSLVDAIGKLDEVRAALAGGPIRLDGGGAVRLTCSAGLALAPDHGTEAGDLVRIADDCLLTAKREGRDRVVVASASPDQVEPRTESLR